MASYDVIIIGAGAAGLMCAISAGQRGRRVLLIDHADKAGAKILISGGGRCNFTNIHAGPENFLSENPHFCKSALGRYKPKDFIGLVDRHGIAWHEKTLGQLFCDQSSHQIVVMLLAEAEDAGVELRLSTSVTSLTRKDEFEVATTSGDVTAPALVLATGGPSIPKMGASGFAYDMARRFGLKVVTPRPALVPFTLGASDSDLVPGLAGVSLPSIASIGKRRFEEAMLFTHRGLSGPSVLQISSYWKAGDTVLFDLMPGQDPEAMLLARKHERPKAELKTILGEMLPARLAQALCQQRFDNRPMNEIGDKKLREIGGLLKRWPFKPSGTEGFSKAEVTAGGIDTGELSSRTLEAKSVPGLYAIGEAVDVTGWLGGYNFQWAWASGWCAGQAV
ncbi:NAD(P)/FAD-dependent oxidoreductase [Radicibacter daui]|uniref:NAD(P)/FAD-dependent oxidoreductase n=1 Tax=Radicibacter daui TaxID=3064829 RepID=UPI004046ABAC